MRTEFIAYLHYSIGDKLDFQLSLDEGKYIVRLARDAIEKVLKSQMSLRPQNIPQKLQAHCGVFVTINKLKGSTHELRGCVGFPYPVKPLAEAIVDSAVSAALNDMRFHPVSVSEMNSILIEVSVLTPPEIIDVNDTTEIINKVKVGKDGLIISRGEKRGLLLPQVPVEYGWSSKEFIEQSCVKARLPRNAWRLPGTEVSKFQAIIFGEEKPRGMVKRMELYG